MKWAEPDSSRRYFVAFAQRVTRRHYWFDVFTRPAWRHCFVLWQPHDVGFKPIVTLEPLIFGTMANFHFGISIEEAVARLLSDDRITVIVEVDVSLTGRVPYFLVGPRSCVNIIKSMLFIHAWRVQTPRQLYRYLIDRGGQLWHRQQFEEAADGR